MITKQLKWRFIQKIYLRWYHYFYYSSYLYNFAYTDIILTKSLIYFDHWSFGELIILLIITQFFNLFWSLIVLLIITQFFLACFSSIFKPGISSFLLFFRQFAFTFEKKTYPSKKNFFADIFDIIIFFLRWFLKL